MEKYLRCSEALYEEIDDEAVVLNIADGCYYGLNATGRALWGMMGQPVTAEQMRAEILRQFSDLSAAEAEQDVNDFLQRLKKCDLAKIHSSEI